MDEVEETTRILILNLNYSVVLDEACETVDKKVTVIYDSERLKPILAKLGATMMRVYCPADLQDYPYAVVDFPAIAKSKSAVEQLQGQCLGYSGRHLRVQYASPYDYTFGGRSMVSEDTREIIVIPLEWNNKQLRSPKILKRTPENNRSRAISPQKNKRSQMLVTKHGRRIQAPRDLVSGAFCRRWP